jgi:hypothetical protein
VDRSGANVPPRVPSGNLNFACSLAKIVGKSSGVHLPGFSGVPKLNGARVSVGMAVSVTVAVSVAAGVLVEEWFSQESLTKSKK